MSSNSNPPASGSSPDATSKVLNFPDGFMWGTATAAFQIEGGFEGRESSIWDDFCNIPGNVLDGDDGKVACDHYNRYASDVPDLLVPLGAKYYRLSLSWPRVLAHGDRACDDVVNSEGVKFYNGLIDTLLSHGIEPVITLYHWDLPSAVARRCGGGWYNTTTADQIAREFAAYAETCFKLFGDRVKWWITINEPFCCAYVAHEIDEHAPGCIDTKRKGVDVYTVGHNLLLAHAYAVDKYRQLKQTGKIGITLNATWHEPYDRDDAACVSATERANQFELGWFAHPIYFGDYPACMREAAGSRLPKFTADQTQLLKGSSDFFGLNHYTTTLVIGRNKGYVGAAVKMDNGGQGGGHSYDNDKDVTTTTDPTWSTTAMGWNIVPYGLGRLVQYVQHVYNPPGGIMVTENGLAVEEPSLEVAVGDEATFQKRIGFYRAYLAELHKAMTTCGDDDGKTKANVIGYFLWSLMDNFEWAFGYKRRFGLYYVDYDTLERSAKPAVQWYANVIKRNAVTLE